MEFIDSHCHVHSVDYTLDPDEAISRAIAHGVTRMICVGTDEKDSALAIEFVQGRQNMWASIGLHPHDAKLGQPAFDALNDLVRRPKVVAIGECGLDYYYNRSSKLDQIKALEFQMELALNNDLPMIFHIREAFDDFWPVFDGFKGLRGVVHSFTASRRELDAALERNLYIGLNGIMTFTNNQEQLDAASAVPLEKLLLETDTPFLTPKPLRGTVNEPKNVVYTAEFLSKLRGDKLERLAFATNHNSIKLFGL